MRPTVEHILAQVVGDAVGPPPAFEPQGDDVPLSAPCQPPRAVVGTAGAVLHGLAGPVPAHPPADGGRRDLETFSRPAHGPCLLPPPDGQDDGAPQGVIAWVMKASGQ